MIFGSISAPTTKRSAFSHLNAKACNDCPCLRTPSTCIKELSELSFCQMLCFVCQLCVPSLLVLSRYGLDLYTALFYPWFGIGRHFPSGQVAPAARHPLTYFIIFFNLGLRTRLAPHCDAQGVALMIFATTKARPFPYLF